MAGVLRNQFTEDMKKTSYDYFWEKYTDITPKYEEYFDVVQSDAAYEQFTSAIGLGELLEKPEGEDLSTDVPMESYTVVCRNRSFGRVVRFSYETVADSQRLKNILADTVGTWGRQVPITKEKFYAKFFNYGSLDAGRADPFSNTISGLVTDSSGNFIYDGLPFFDTAHPDKVGNTYANFTASRSLTHTNLISTYETFVNTNNRDERGDIVDITPDVLLIPTALKFTADVILKTTAIPGNMDNDVNVLQTIVPSSTWAYLTDTDGWFLGKKKMGLMATDRQDVILDFWQDELNKDYFASIFTRFGGAVTNWRFWYAQNTATT